MRADAVRHQRNLHVRSELKTLVKSFEQAVAARSADQARDLLRLITKKLDMATQKGMVHKNTSARKKSRLSRRLAHLAPAA